MKTLCILGAALAVAASTAAATADSGSYSGNWPVTVTKSQFYNGSYCLTVTDDGSQGWPHSGSATVAQYQLGLFQVIRGKFMADIVVPSGDQNNTLLFTAAGRNGTFGNGAVQLLAGGEPLDSGLMTVGKRGGC
jgi:hypothetical protein